MTWLWATRPLPAAGRPVRHVPDRSARARSRTRGIHIPASGGRGYHIPGPIPDRTRTRMRCSIYTKIAELGSVCEILKQTVLLLEPMASRPVLVEWYQSETTVTASVKLKGVPSDVTVTAKFESQRCAIHIGGDKLFHMHHVDLSSLLQCAIVPD